MGQDVFSGMFCLEKFLLNPAYLVNPVKIPSLAPLHGIVVETEFRRSTASGLGS